MAQQGLASVYTLLCWERVLYSKAVILGGAAVCAGLNLAFWSYMVRVRASLVYKFEFDTNKEMFVLT